MLDDILRFGANFDWMSPLAAFAMDIANGPSHTFLIPTDCGWSGHEINRLLKKRGVKTWGLMVVNDTIMVSVKQDQTRYAQYILDQAGVPIDIPVSIEPKENAKSEPKTWDLSWLDKIG